MYKICKITENPVVDFAAEELKKYLRMMMPRCGEIPICYDRSAEDGFRLGLMSDFSLDTAEAEDLELDDIIHIETDLSGGIIAGSNPRSVLLAVYRYLTINGCRWLFPGVDGEFIPIWEIQPVCYHKMADCRYRGQCNEGAESQQCMLETIDFSPKIGLNVYMLEFDIPTAYYGWYYEHKHNEENRQPEPVSDQTVLQWKRACEAEIAKRGLQFHDIGHGWTAEAFGIRTDGWETSEQEVKPEILQYLAVTKGRRWVHHNVPLNTNFCMSNPEARAIVTKAVCDYAELERNVDFLHVWLADSQKNHCECENCREKTPSDWYVILLNDIDEELTRRNLQTRIAMNVYSDTAYEPTCEYIRNPKRFLMTLGAITRSYTYSIPENPVVEKLTEFELNKSGRIETMEEHIVRLKNWKQFLPAPAAAYEYHFWKHQFYAPGTLSFARRIYEDVKSYVTNGLQGIIEDGSQRAFFPNGLSYYVYGSALFDNSVSFESLVEDYFSHAYGEAAGLVLDFLKEIDRLMPQTYLEARHSAKREKSKYYQPLMAQSFLSVEPLTREFEEKLSAYQNMPFRVQTVAVRLMLHYAAYCRGFADVLAIKCLGKDEEAKAAAAEFRKEFGKREIAIERYYDHTMAIMAHMEIWGNKSEYMQ